MRQRALTMASKRKSNDKIKRLPPTKDVLRALFARSGNRCAFPGCDHPLIDERDKFVAQICHIEAAAEGGERFNPNQTNEERRGYQNLVLFCYQHHVTTNDVTEFTVAKLREIKNSHENKNTDFLISNQTLNSVYEEEIKKITQLLERHGSELREHREEFAEHAQKADHHQEVVEDGLGTIKGMLSQIQRQHELLQIDDLPEFDAIKTFKDDNKPKAALVLINKIKEKKWTKLSVNAQYKILINEGICYLDLEKPKQAADAFLKALPLNSNDDNALAYAAIGYHLQKKADEAEQFIQKALKTNPKNVNAYNVLIQLRKKTDFPSLKATIPSDLLNISEISYNLAITARIQGHYPEAIQLLQTCVNKSKKSNPLFLGALGSTILTSITKDTFAHVSGQITQEERTKAEYAIENLSKAWAIYENTEVKNHHGEILIHRAIGKKLLKDLAGAYQDISRACDLVPKNYHFRKHLVIISTELDKFSEALTACDQLLEHPKRQNQAVLLKVDLLQKLERYQESLELLNGLATKQLAKFDQKFLRHYTIAAYTGLGRLGDATKYIDSIITTDPTEISPRIDAVLFWLNQNDTEQATLHLTEAYKLVNESSSKHELFELAQICYKLKDFEKAAGIYEMISDARIYSEITRRLIQSLYNAGKRKKALEICLQLEKDYGLDRFLADGLGMIYESIDDLPNSIAICNKYLDLNPDDQVILFRLAFLYERLEMKEELTKTLARIGPIDYSLKLESLYRLAHVYFVSGLPEVALEIAYETRRSNYNKGQAHVHFFGLLQEFKVEKAEHIYESVQQGTAVRVRDAGGDIIAYVIEDRKDALAERGELDLSNEVAQMLLNKRVGDQIVLNHGSFTERKLDVIEIVSKYHFAMQETYRLFSTRFINEPSIKVVHMPPGDTAKERLAPIFSAIDADEQIHTQLHDLYVNGRAPIGVIASLRRVNPIRTFFHLASDKRLGIRPIWHTTELARVIADLNNAAPIVLDLTAIAVYAALESLPLLERLPNRKVIVQSTFDTVRDLIRELRMSSEGMSTIGKVNGEYVREDVTPERIQNSIDHYESVLKWLRANCEFRPVNVALEMDIKALSEIEKLIGDSFNDSLLVGKELNAVLVSEDNPYRQLAAGEHKVNGIYAFLLSTYMVDKGMITEAENTEFTLKLFALNYQGLPCNMALLRESVKRAKYQPTDPFTLVLSGLTSPLMPEKIAINIVMGFLLEIYSDSSIQIYSSLSIDTIRMNLAIPILKALFRRSIDLRYLAQALAIKFQLLPEQRDTVNDIIRELLKDETIM